MLKNEQKSESENLRIHLSKVINFRLDKHQFDEIQSPKLINAKISKCKLSNFKDDQSQIENDI